MNRMPAGSASVDRFQVAWARRVSKDWFSVAIMRSSALSILLKAQLAPPSPPPMLSCTALSRLSSSAVVRIFRSISR